MTSVHTCLICIRYDGTHRLQCGHSICDVCVRTFGRPDTSVEYQFLLRGCLLCKHPSPLTVRQVPPTAGPRILAIDGGGIGGVVSLEALSRLEKAMSTTYPLQEEFDYVIGTSSGNVFRAAALIPVAD